jgi:hypothetical protein
MIDVVLDVSGIYGAGGDISHANDGDGSTSLPPKQSAIPAESMSTAEDGDANDNVGADLYSNTTADSALEYPVDARDELVGTLIGQGASGYNQENDGAVYDGETSSIIRLGNGMVRIFVTGRLCISET